MAGAREEMLDTNRRQAAYYEQANGSAASEINGSATNAWRWIRRRAMNAVSPDCRGSLNDRHRAWLGDLRGKKVLELGSSSGSPLTRHMARQAGSYHAIDLSASKIAELRKKLGEAPNVTLHAGDFLADSFVETGFDVIYARSVIHHFRHLEPLFARLDGVLAPGGRIITFDPVQAWLPIRALRALYRPFQTDAEWEFPFEPATLRLIESRFQVIERVSLYRRAKWAMILATMSPALGRRYGDRWFAAEVAQPATAQQVRGGLQVSYLMTRKGDAA